MALQRSINRRRVKSSNDDGNNAENHPYDHEYDEEIDETEDDLIENYRFLTQHCGVLRQSPTTSVLSAIQQQQQKQTNQTSLLRQCLSIDEKHCNIEHERSLPHTSQRYSPSIDLDSNNNNNHSNDSTTRNRIPPTVYYDDLGSDVIDRNRSFSLVKLFARMKARLKHDKRYRPRPTHELLSEEDPQEWLELTKNVRTVLTKALLPNGGYDAITNRSRKTHSRQGSCKKAREQDIALTKSADDDFDRIDIVLDDNLNTQDDEDHDQIIWSEFLTCSRGSHYRRNAVCKAVDRQQFQGQLVYFYGVANNILIDENLKASGLG